MIRRQSLFLALFCALLLAALTAVSCGGHHAPVSIRVMTWNLHHCEGEDGVYDVGRIAEFIKSSGADIILCQEVDREFSDRSKMERQPELLAEKTGLHFYYGPNIGETYGNMILSRFPIETAENIPLPNPENKEPRGVIKARIVIEGITLTLLDTHLSAFEETNRIEQVAFLKELTKSLEAPVIFGADFNTKPSEQLKPLLDNGVLSPTRDVVFSLGEGIDDILVSAALKGKVTDGKVIESVFSDHPAYRIDLRIGK